MPEAPERLAFVIRLWRAVRLICLITSTALFVLIMGLWGFISLARWFSMDKYVDKQPIQIFLNKNVDGFGAQALIVRVESGERRAKRVAIYSDGPFVGKSDSLVFSSETNTTREVISIRAVWGHQITGERNHLRMGRPSPNDPMTQHVSFPLWFLLVLTIAYPVLAVMRGPLRRWQRRRKGHCANCDYDLTGNESGVCPECGEQLKDADK